MNYPFEDDLYILNCVELRKGPCVKLFTKVHQFDLVLTDAENMTSHYVGSCQNTNNTFSKQISNFKYRWEHLPENVR